MTVSVRHVVCPGWRFGLNNNTRYCLGYIWYRFQLWLSFNLTHLAMHTAQFHAMIHWIYNCTSWISLGSVTEILAPSHHHKSLVYRSSLSKGRFSIQCNNIQCIDWTSLCFQNIGQNMYECWLIPLEVDYRCMTRCVETCRSSPDNRYNIPLVSYFNIFIRYQFLLLLICIVY